MYRAGDEGCVLSRKRRGWREPSRRSGKMVESGNETRAAMPMRGTTIVAALFAASAIMATGALAQEPKTDTQASQEAPQWPAFRSPERGFEIAFPATPKSTSSSVAGQNPLIRYSFEGLRRRRHGLSPRGARISRRQGAESGGRSLYVKMVSAYAKDSESKVRKRGPKTIASRDGSRPSPMTARARSIISSTSSLPATASTCWSPPVRAATPRRRRRAVPRLLPRHRRRTGDHRQHARDPSP